jgi:HD superfamily phosphohydrolase YqeK
VVSSDGRPAAPQAVESSLPLAEEILSAWRETLGPDFIGYHNHVYRVINYSLALRTCSDEEREKLAIAACFHDLGI